MLATKHAVYATAQVVTWPKGQRPNVENVTFRVGQPVSLHTADSRWDRLNKRRGRLYVKHDGRRYPIKFVEVRQVDRFGRRIDSNRSDSPLTVPYRAARAR